jgi:Flp pilus assembly protein TadG
MRGQSVTEFALIFPVLMVLVLAIGDFARWYSTAITIESAAREAADYGAFSAERWAVPNVPGTEEKMRERACTSASTLSGYQGDPVGTPGMTCTNPTFAYVLVTPPGITDCSINANDPPCQVTVTVTYQFDLFIPVPLVTPSFSFSRDSTYSVSPFPAS